MKVVIDTNIFVSSFFGGHPRKIIDLWKSGKITICVSGEIIDEYVEVLQRIGLKGEDELDELLVLFAEGYNCLFTSKPPTLKVVQGDPDDNKFVECALAGKCKIIVSGDKHLLKLTGYKGITVLNPRDFANRYL